ncbi:MAG TPA: ADP-ribosylglycohydrolase family protein [Symbiobacteriaceae bacterium]|nr:ADP-ribosylglycohydrolase family protein [Symbiobacteriaceae bacterium]
MPDWEQRLLDTWRASRPAYDEKPQWRAALALYDGLTPHETLELDRTLLGMISEEYRNPHSSDREDLPFDDVMVNLPAGMSPDDLMCVEGAALVAAERGLGPALFALNRLMRSPRWHAMYSRLHWLSQEGFEAQSKLLATDAGRYLGAVLGLAVGDALGVTLEFLSREEVRRQYPEGHREITGGGPFGFAQGEWSDDTAMALAVARGIAESPADPVEAVGRHFQDWYGSHPPDVGNTCRTALEAHRRTGSWEAASAEVARLMGGRAGGNGALMRTLPAALAYGADPTQAVRIARMTHPHPESDEAVRIYHTIAAALLSGAGKAAAFDSGLQEAKLLQDRISRAPNLTEAGVKSSGYVVDTLEAAIWAFMGTDSLEACIVQAVGLGDDADTVGAVAGGLAGAHYGARAIPRRWTTEIRRRIELEEAAQQLHAVRQCPV